MEKSKLIEILKTFDKKELKCLDEMVHSPYFNKHDKVIQLWEFVKKHYPRFVKSKINKEFAYQHVFGKEKYQDQKFRNLMTELSKILEKYFIQETLNANLPAQERYLIEGLRNKNIEKYTLAQLGKTQRAQLKRKHKDVSYYYHQYKLEELHREYMISSYGRAREDNLNKVVNNLDNYYLANKLRYCCVILNRQSLSEEKLDVHLLSEILDYVEQTDFEAVPAITIYHRMFLMLQNQADEVHYPKLKTLLTKHNNVFPRDELRQIYTAMYNHCNRQLKNGSASFLREIFELYKEMLQSKVLIYNGMIAPYIHFRNIVRAAVRLGELDWADNFIVSYQNKIPKEHQESMVGYCLATLNFYRKEYQQTLDHLLAFELQDFYNYIEHKILLIQTYYELQEYEALLAMIHAFRVYLRRKDVLPAHHQTTYSNFIKFVEKTYRAKLSYETDVNKLKEEINNTSPMNDKEWLLEKVTEIKRR